MIDAVHHTGGRMGPQIWHTGATRYINAATVHKCRRRSKFTDTSVRIRLQRKPFATNGFYKVLQGLNALNQPNQLFFTDFEFR
ncbi:hypothetical protein EV291_11146 [Rhizobium sp. BK068]|nr:hypothetical protein EV291_11146 [Rhizobium sp. BK068]